MGVNLIASEQAHVLQPLASKLTVENQSNMPPKCSHPASSAVIIIH